MQEQLKQVSEFMTRLEIPQDRVFPSATEDGTRELFIIAMALERCSVRLKAQTKHAGVPDLRVQRAQLIVEEVGELLEALAKKDEVGACDAMTDLLYVVLGLALTYNWPLEQLFAEVHRSNMTKFLMPGDTDPLRHGSVKGTGYEPPRLKEIILQHFAEHYVRTVSEIVPAPELDEPALSREEVQAEADAAHEAARNTESFEDNLDSDGADE